MTIQKLRSLAPHAEIARGECPLPELDLDYVKWVAVRGYILDWAIYLSPYKEDDYAKVSCYGAKLCNSKAIKRLVPCTAEAYRRYRF